MLQEFFDSLATFWNDNWLLVVLGISSLFFGCMWFVWGQIAKDRKAEIKNLERARDFEKNLAKERQGKLTECIQVIAGLRDSLASRGEIVDTLNKQNDRQALVIDELQTSCKEVEQKYGDLDVSFEKLRAVARRDYEQLEALRAIIRRLKRGTNFITGDPEKESRYLKFMMSKTDSNRTIQKKAPTKNNVSKSADGARKEMEGAL